ncbi:MAG: hypothetical protein ACHQUC_08595 [Chlamydiales bacterium]
MALECVTASSPLSHYQPQESGNVKKDNLKGIMPRDALVEHLMFQLNNFFQGRVCSEQNMYDVSCRTAASSIQGIIPRQLTAGGGGG